MTVTRMMKKLAIEENICEQYEGHKKSTIESINDARHSKDKHFYFEDFFERHQEVDNCTQCNFFPLVKEELCEDTEIKSFQFSYPRPEHAEDLAEVLKQNHSIEKFVFYDVRDGNTLSLIADALKSNESIKELIIRPKLIRDKKTLYPFGEDKNYLNIPDALLYMNENVVTKLADMLTKNSTITTFKWHGVYTHLAPHETKILLEGLEKNTSITCLQLTHISIKSEDCMQALKNLLIKNTVLTQLDIVFPRVDQAHLPILHEGINENKTLKKIRIGEIIETNNEPESNPKLKRKM